jgi:hypothetical protein
MKHFIVRKSTYKFGSVFSPPYKSYSTGKVVLFETEDEAHIACMELNNGYCAPNTVYEYGGIWSESTEKIG